MDEQNYGNGQNGGSSNNSQSGNYYQDYTANMSQYQPPSQNEGPNKANGIQIASLVLGIIGIPASCCYGIGLLFGIIGLILALVGNKQNKGSGIGIGGLVCSVIAIIFGILAAIYYVIIFMGMMGSGPFADMVQQIMENMGYGYDYY